MKKILPILIVGILVLSGLGAGALNKEKNKKQTETIMISFSMPSLEEIDNNNIEVHLKEETSYMVNPGQPVLPKVVKAVELDFGVKNVKVEVTIGKTHEYTIDKQIIPASGPVSTIENNDIINEKDEDVYSSDEMYPSNWYSYSVRCGLNADNDLVTYVPIHITPIRYSPALDKIYVAEDAEIKVTYEESTKTPVLDEYDLVIIAPNEFSDILQRRLVSFKNSVGIRTFLKTTEKIYDEYEGVDKPEQIKYFIKDAIEQYDVKYVLLVGGLKRYWDNNDRDNCNEGSTDWHLPVRYTNNYDMGEGNTSGVEGDPGFISDLYYADIYKEGGEFEDWDPNGDGIFAAWGKPGAPRDVLDLIPDVYVGRLACRNKIEVKIMINKIINYEKEPADPSWFNRLILISGDSFQDQGDLDIQWDTNDLPDGTYTIYAQSNNPDGIYGPIDVVDVTVDHASASSITFKEDDHLKVDSYPAPPIAEITSPSEGDILGNTDVQFVPPDAYSGSEWAEVEYSNGIMHIRGKSYDPQPYGNYTDIKVWIKNSDGDEIFSHQINDSESWFEGEWACGDKYLYGRTGVMGYMPDNFENIILWTSNGNYTHKRDIIKEWNKGSGFIFISMHASPALWSQHNPGIPGGRHNASIKALSIINDAPPFFPANRLSNFNKLPIVVGSLGCHHSEFNVSIYKTMTIYGPCNAYWTYGTPTPECLNWWITRLPKRGAIATIGNTGTGYAWLGGRTLSHGSGWFAPEFFRLYSEENMHNLGQPFAHAVTNYIIIHGVEYRQHVKMMEEWTLLGDPTLMIGGYS